MLIVASTRIKTKIQEQLKAAFPEESFSFFNKMDEAESQLSQADVLLTYGEDLDEGKIELAHHLKWIHVLAAGLDQMPLEKIKERGILVTNARGIHKIPMAEYTLAMILQTAKHTKQLIENESLGVWDRKVRMNELFGKTITILGVGSIGQEIARLTKAFGMKTVGVNRSGQPAEHVDEVFATSDLSKAIQLGDYIVSVLPSTRETTELLNYGHFQDMKNDAIFINIGRGDLYKEEDLKRALVDGEISHAVLDVFETEPLPKEHHFYQMANVTVTPHISGITSLYQERAFEIFKANLVKYKNEEKDLINKIDLSRGY